MPVWILQVVLAIIPLVGKLIDKYVPDKVTRKREFKSKKKCVDAMNRFHGWTIEEIAAYERKRQRKFNRLADSGSPRE